MSGINRVILIGRVGQDPVYRASNDAGGFTIFSIATSEKWKDKTSGEAKESTEWHSIVANGRLAEVVRDYVTKGSNIYVEGKMKTRKWTDKEGASRQTTEIVMTQLQLLDSKGASERGERTQQVAKQAQVDQVEFDDSDIPF
jgi:single-strand DNA-binding protein